MYEKKAWYHTKLLLCQLAAVWGKRIQPCQQLCTITGQRSGTLPSKWSLTWQVSSHFPSDLGTISAVAKVAGNRLRTSVRWPRSSSVFPWKKAEWISTSLPMPNKCQATVRPWHSVIPGRFPNRYPLIAVREGTDTHHVARYAGGKLRKWFSEKHFNDI